MGDGGISWEEAADAAIGMGGHLVSITTTEENSCVMGLMTGTLFYLKIIMMFYLKMMVLCYNKMMNYESKGEPAWIGLNYSYSYSCCTQQDGE